MTDDLPAQRSRISQRIVLDSSRQIRRIGVNANDFEGQRFNVDHLAGSDDQDFAEIGNIVGQSAIIKGFSSPPKSSATKIPNWRRLHGMG